MDFTKKALKLQRDFTDVGLKIDTWQAVSHYYTQLLGADLSMPEKIDAWLKKRSELISIIEEEKAWKYIQASRYTEEKEYSDNFASFTEQIEPKIISAENELDKKLMACYPNGEVPFEYRIFLRNIKKQLELFREINVPLIAKLEVQEQKYSVLSGKMSIFFKGRELTLQQADNLLKSGNRKVRKEVFELIQARRGGDEEELNVLFAELIRRRDKIAKNAGYNNYLEYRFDNLSRFDYTIKDCEVFHNSVKEVVVPIANSIFEERKQALGYNRLYPYDLKVNINQMPALKPFKNNADFIDKSISCLNRVDTEFGDCLKLLSTEGFLDLESRKGKAPGGYNYPLFESNIPFIFMNASNSLRDLTTLMHESGHAIHSILTGKQPLVYYKEFPSEIAELASMAMELMSMEHWDVIFENHDELKRARIEHIEDIIHVLPWVASIDKFQHWIYKNPQLTASDRMCQWERIRNEFESPVIDWSGFEQHRKIQWQKQIHLFQFPLYYIEYGIAQLGAIGIWKNYKADPEKTVAQYKHALSLGYTKTLPELYKAAGVPFDFSEAHIGGLMQFIKNELAKMKGDSL